LHPAFQFLLIRTCAHSAHSVVLGDLVRLHESDTIVQRPPPARIAPSPPFSCMEYTIMGMLFSRASAIAAVSITASPRLMTSAWLIRSKRVAAGSRFGSAE